jgi:hypothetical protein
MCRWRAPRAALHACAPARIGRCASSTSAASTTATMLPLGLSVSESGLFLRQHDVVSFERGALACIAMHARPAGFRRRVPPRTKLQNQGPHSGPVTSLGTGAPQRALPGPWSDMGAAARPPWRRLLGLDWLPRSPNGQRMSRPRRAGAPWRALISAHGCSSVLRPRKPAPVLAWRGTT